MDPMDSGRCRWCGRPYTSGEVAGLGVLRSRPAAQGGPRIELECPGCKTVLVFVPHGNGRYAPPGQPPPPPPTEEEMRLPWRKTPAFAASVAGPPPPAPPPPVKPTGPAVAAAPSAGAQRAAQDDDEPLVDPFAACALLGVSPSAEAAAIEAAFRERALQCHPDKVAHLDPDIQAVARRKFRRLQEARDLLLG
jgi:hypothetical protein